MKYFNLGVNKHDNALNLRRIKIKIFSQIRINLKLFQRI